MNKFLQFIKNIFTIHEPKEVQKAYHAGFYEGLNVPKPKKKATVKKATKTNAKTVKKTKAKSKTSK